MASLQSGESPPRPALAIPVRDLRSLPAGVLAVSGLALLAGMALAWLYIVGQAAGMGNRAGTMGLGLWAFLGMWAVMVVAMMFPSVAPTAFWLAERDATIAGIGGMTEAAGMLWRLKRTTIFLLGYFAIWVIFGLTIYAVLTGAAGIVHLSAHDDKWVAAAVYVVAGAYQLTPAKRACRDRCRAPRCAAGEQGLLARWGVVGESAHHALTCIGCCWAFMAVLIAVGLMNVVAMMILTVVIFVERYLTSRALVSNTAGGLLVAAAVLTPFFGWLHPGLPGSSGGMPMHM